VRRFMQSLSRFWISVIAGSKKGEFIEIIFSTGLGLDALAWALSSSRIYVRSGSFEDLFNRRLHLK
jgi:hypothetical protein